MKRAVLAMALLLGATFAARADVDVWSQLTSNGDLDAAVGACNQQVGAHQNGAPTSAQYKRCMLRHGWRYVRTNRIPTWRDPETGEVCHNEGGATICCSPCRDGG